jgi:hypothetical protein
LSTLGKVTQAASGTRHHEIAGSRFIINSEAVLLLGPPGVGKTRIWRSPSAVRRSSPATRCCFHAGDDVDGPAFAEAHADGQLEERAQVSLYPWKDTADKIPLAVRHIRTFLRAHRPVAAAQSMAAAAQ